MASFLLVIKFVKGHKTNFNLGHKNQIEQWNWVPLPFATVFQKRRDVCDSHGLAQHIFEILSRLSCRNCTVCHITQT